MPLTCQKDIYIYQANYRTDQPNKLQKLETDYFRKGLKEYFKPSEGQLYTRNLNKIYQALISRQNQEVWIGNH